MNTDSTFFEALIASLNQQRSTLPNSGQKPLCDVILRCGGIATQAHSSVLVALSTFFARILTNRKSTTQVLTPISSSPLVTIDVAKIFRGVENLFPIVIDSLYTGVQVVSCDVKTNTLLSAAYSSLELKLPFVTPKVEITTTDNNVNIQTQLEPVTSSLNEVGDAVTDDESRNADEVMDLSICPQCNMLFVSREEFLAHTKAKCARKITCFTCGKLFTRVQGLATHLVEVRHGETICSICGHEGESQKDAAIHIRKHAMDHDRPYFCVNCDARFSTRKKWENHLPKHSSEAPFVCKECGKGFKWKHALTAHSVIHAPEKKFLCQECGFSTSHMSTFKIHNRMHSGNLMKCDVKNCTFQTSRKSNLVQHRLTHSKEKPHQCEICGQSFSLAKNMRRHARQHDSNATIYQCNVRNCIFKSLRSDKYIEHMKKNHSDLEPPPPPPPPQPLAARQQQQQKTPVITSLSLSELPSTTSTTTTVRIKTEVKAEIINKPNNSLLTTSPFNTISPPNKTVVDTFEEPNFPENQFDEAIIIAATASEDDLTKFVSPLL